MGKTLQERSSQLVIHASSINIQIPFGPFAGSGFKDILRDALPALYSVSVSFASARLICWERRGKLRSASLRSDNSVASTANPRFKWF